MQGIDEIAQQRLVAAEPARLGDGEFKRIARELLDDLAFRPQHQGGVRGEIRRRALQRPEEEAEDHEEEREVQHLAQTIETPEQKAEYLLHAIILPSGGPLRGVYPSGQTFSSIRAALPDRSRK